MAHPIIIQEGTLRNYLGSFRDEIRPAQWTYFETVLMGSLSKAQSSTIKHLGRFPACCARSPSW